MGEGCGQTGISRRWRTVCGRTTSTSAGLSPPCSDRVRSSPASNLGTRVQSPIEYIVGAVRALGNARPAAEHTGAGRLGGPDGPGPLQSPQRRRLAGWTKLAVGPVVDRPRQLREPHWSKDKASAAKPRSTRSRLAGRHRRGADRARNHLILCPNCCWDSNPIAHWIEQLGSKTAWNPESARRAIAQLLATPEAQVC